MDEKIIQPEYTTQSPEPTISTVVNDGGSSVGTDTSSQWQDFEKMAGERPAATKGFFGNENDDAGKEWDTGKAAYGEFEHLTTGIDPRGIKRVLETQIKPRIIDKAIALLQESSKYDDFVEQCMQNWKGESRKKFLEKLDTSREEMAEDIKKEFWSIYNRFNELEDNYRQQDIQLSDQI